MIKVKNLSKTYQNGYQALTNVSFEIQPGEFVSVSAQVVQGKVRFLKLYRVRLSFLLGALN